MGDQFGIYLHKDLSGRGCQDDAGVHAALSTVSSPDDADAL